MLCDLLSTWPMSVDSGVVRGEIFLCFLFFFLFLKEEEVKDFSKNIFCGIRICENDYDEYSNIRDF